MVEEIASQRRTARGKNKEKRDAGRAEEKTDQVEDEAVSLAALLAGQVRADQPRDLGGDISEGEVRGRPVTIAVHCAPQVMFLLIQF